MATKDQQERARRQDRLQRVEAAFEPIPFDTFAARAYGRIFAAVVASGRNPRGRVADLLTASVSLAKELPPYTRNPDDFVGLDSPLEIVTL